METAVYPVPDDRPCPENQTMFQAFEWYLPSDHQHWKRVTAAIPDLAALGVTSMWIPPACKASWHDTNGYDIYDLWDLGEFDQKGGVETKWGHKKDLVSLTDAAAAHGVGVLFDAVLNHKAAADYPELVSAVRVDPKDRGREVGNGPEEVEVWTGYRFPGRGKTYSPMEWRAEHFTGIDYDQKTNSNVLWKFVGKEWAHDVDEELGNYDYLMFADIDHNHPEVRRDMFAWAEWLGSQLKLGGLRVDAIKHYSASFLRDLIRHIDRTPAGRGWFIVGEYWRADSRVLAEYVDYMDGRISLFDVELCCNFSRVSMGEEPDLRTVFEGTLCAMRPANAVTFVMNHDTQERQSLETPIAPFFVPLAYALILLRLHTGIPCVFWADLYGSLGPDAKPDRSTFRPPPAEGHVIPRLMLARRLYAYGTQTDYFDRPQCVGFTRKGHASRSGGAGCAVLVNVGWRYATKRMSVGTRHRGERWTDLLGMTYGVVVVDGDGYGVFPVLPRGVAVWVCEAAAGRELVEGFEFHSDIFGFAEEDRRIAEEKRLVNRLRNRLSVPSWLGSRRASRLSVGSVGDQARSRSRGRLSVGGGNQSRPGSQGRLGVGGDQSRRLGVEEQSRSRSRSRHSSVGRESALPLR